MLEEMKAILFHDKSFLLLFGMIGLVLVAAVIRIVYGTIVRHDWGINRIAIHCPRCKAATPQFRFPSSFREFMWGGYTCGTCGTQIDKWGRELVPRGA